MLTDEAALVVEDAGGGAVRAVVEDLHGAAALVQRQAGGQQEPAGAERRPVSNRPGHSSRIARLCLFAHAIQRD